MRPELMRIDNIFPDSMQSSILNNARFNIREGEIVGAIGLFDSGRSDVARIVGGLGWTGNCAMYFREEPLSDWNEAIALEKGVVYIGSYHSLVESLDVTSNVLMRANHGRIWINDRRNHEKCRKILDGMRVEMDCRRRVEDLGYADRLAVLLAKALAQDACLIVIDNLLYGLNRAQVTELRRLLGLLRDRGVAVALFDSDIEAVMALTDRAFVYRDGMVVSTCARDQYDLGRMSQIMVGREVNLHLKRHDYISADHREAVNLKRRDTGEPLLSVSEGSMTNLIVDNEADVIDILGAFTGARGSRWAVELDGRPLTRKIARQSVGLVYSESTVFGNLSIRENILLRHARACARAGMFIDNRRLFHDYSVLTREFLGEDARALQNHDISELDRYHRKLVEISRGMLDASRLMVYYNPSYRMMNIAAENIFERIGQINARGVTTLIITGDIMVCSSICDKVCFMKDGRAHGTFLAEETDIEEMIDKYKAMYLQIGEG